MSRRKHVYEPEVARMMEAAKQGRHAARDRCLIAVTFRHGLRASEAAGLDLSDIDADGWRISVHRLKRGLSGIHPMRAPEPRLAQAWLRDRAKLASPGEKAFFVTERGGRMTRHQVYYLIRRYGELAGLPVLVRPHMLRHGCGFALADQGADTRLIQDYLGHRSIQNTVIYTASNAARFEKLWR